MLGVTLLDVRVDAREEHREDRGERELPDLEQDESEASDETTAHVRTLASPARIWAAR
jgi:hypothetical protein